MTTLVSIFTGTDEKLQLEAAWCLTNIATGSEEHALSILKHAGAYLVTYLSSGNGPLEVCTPRRLANCIMGAGSSFFFLLFFLFLPLSFSSFCFSSFCYSFFLFFFVFFGFFFRFFFFVLRRCSRRCWVCLTLSRGPTFLSVVDLPQVNFLQAECSARSSSGCRQEPSPPPPT